VHPHSWPCPAPAPVHCDLFLFHRPSHRSSSTTTITLMGLLPDTIKADVRFILQRFGQVTYLFVQPDGRHTDVVFADVHPVKCTLHAYAETLLYLGGREIIVFGSTRKRTAGRWKSMIRIRILRRRPHGLGRVVMTERFLCPTFPPRRRRRNFRSLWNLSELGTSLDPTTSRLFSRSLRGRRPGSEVGTSHRACSGSDGCYEYLSHSSHKLLESRLGCIVDVRICMYVIVPISIADSRDRSF
jgi:hypothetical protein